MSDNLRFRRGDYIRVTPNNSSKPIILGAATSMMGFTGYSLFEVLGGDGTIHKFNMNEVSVEVVFSADVARQIQPLPKIDEDIAAATIFGMMWNVVDQNATMGMIRDAAGAAFQETVRLIESKWVDE